jgi:O-antigen ligase
MSELATGSEVRLWREAAGPSRIEAWLFWSLLLLVSVMPLPFGSNRPWSWSLAGVVVGLLLLLHALWAAGSRGRVLRVAAGRIVIPLLIAAPAILWAAMQILPLPPDLAGRLADPLWARAGAALGADLTPRISSDPVATVGALMRLATELGVFALAVMLLRSRRRARRALSWLAGAAALYALYGLIAFVATPGKLLWFERWAYQGDLTSTFVNRNSFATFAGLGLLANLALLAQRLEEIAAEGGAGRGRLAALLGGAPSAMLRPALSVLLLASAILLSHSRGGFLSAGAGTAVLLGLLLLARRLSGAAKLLVGIAGVAVVALTMVVSGGLTLQRLGETQLQEERADLYRIVATGIAARPWTGHGYGAFDLASRAYHDGSLFSDYERAHDDYLEAAFELGIPAASSLVAAIAYVALSCVWGVRRRRRDMVYPALGAAAAALVACHALVDFSLQIPAVAAWFAALLALGYSQSWRSEEGLVLPS